MAKTGSEDIDIFEDLQYQNFGDSQEYFDYLKERSQEYDEYASDPEKVKKDRETFFNQTTDLLKIAPNAGVETANMLMTILEAPADIYALMSGTGNMGNITQPNNPIPRLEYSDAGSNMEYVDKTAAYLEGSPLAFFRGLDLIANKAPKAYKMMR